MISAAGCTAVASGLWVGHATSCQRGTGATEACIRVVRIKVGQNAAGKFTAAVTGTSTIGGSDGDFYFQPGLAVNVAKQAAVAFQTSSRTSKMSAAFSLQDGTTAVFLPAVPLEDGDRKSTRLNSSHGYISYAVFCLKKKRKQKEIYVGE